MENEHGVKCSGNTLYGYFILDNAKCWCGDDLLLAPRALGQNLAKISNENDLVFVCADFAHDSFRFGDIKTGLQNHE